MANPIVGLCTIKLHLPGVSSLKEKRGIIKSMLTRVHNVFNVSASEIDHHDVWQSSTIAVATVSNSSSHVNQVINNVLAWIESNYPEVLIIAQEIETL